MDELYIKERISDLISLLTKVTELNQIELASLLGVNQSRLSQYINKKGEPKLTTVLRLSKLSGLKLDDIFSEKPLSDFASTIRYHIKDNFMPKEKNANQVFENVNSKYFAAGDIHIINKKVQRTYKHQQQPGDITSEQASKLKEIVNDIVELEKTTSKKPKSHAAVWALFDKKFGVTYYRELKKERFEEAEIYLSKWRGKLKKDALKTPGENDPRKALYASIFTVGKKHLGMTEQDVDNYIMGSFGANSIKDLKDEELTKLYNRFMSKKNEKK